ncbi:MAG TPA: ABC transporter substrate-binding protein [Methylomirabilota bacterium]|jgi:putative ABC transport system substrate-binding protein|nr:ABC transporter substrate-binding protein [Methylomirabilota bacterium]
MNRREFIGAVAAPLLAQAQRPGRVPRIAMLGPAVDRPQSIARVELEAGLRKLGWIPGQTLIIERRQGTLDRLPELAAELVRLKVDIILASSVAIPAARAATQTIPIIMAFGVDDPVEAGYATSLGRPGSNITGVFLQAPEAGGKRLELLRAAMPTVTRVAVLSWPGKSSASQVRGIELAAQSLGIRVQVVEVSNAAGYEGAFVAMGKQGSRAALVVASAVSFNDRRPIIELASKHRVALVAPFREYAEDGALMGYGANIPELWRERVPLYVDKILRGANPADLPVEQPTKFELVINLKTAKAFGLTLPQSLLFRADRVIQ